jgi:large subunit ribosomal protein L25
MKRVSLSGSSRANVGKKDAADLRRAGRVPCVNYGTGTQTHFHVAYLDAERLVKTPNVYMVDIDVEGKKLKGIIQDVQFNPVSDKIIHIDFLEVQENAPIKVKLPIKLTGFAIGVRSGGKLRQNFRKVTVLGMEKDLPENVEIDITPMKIGAKIRVADLKSDGIKFLDAESAVVVAVQMARGAKKPGDDEESEEG